MTLAVAAQVGNLRCSWPRTGTTITHPATFGALSCATCGTPDAGDRICPRCWSAATRPTIPGIGAPKPEPRVLPKDSPLVSRNGIRLPLRAIPWRELNRRFWSQGKVVYADRLERSTPRELLVHEKTPEQMTWEEIRDTAHLEPLSESRRSWLERGAGVLSLDGIAYGEGSIGETLALKGSLGALGTLAPSEPSAGFADEASSIGKGVPYVTLDPITAKQIEWEQEQWHTGPLVRTRLTNRESGGGLTFATFDRNKKPLRLLEPDMVNIGRRIRRTLVALVGTPTVDSLDDLHERLAALRASDALAFDPAPDWREERERYLAPADLEWHTSFEFAQPVVAIYPPFTKGTYTHEWCPRNFGRRPRCFVYENHRHERITRIAHRGTPHHDPAYELWHQRIFDTTAFEIGTNGLVDPLVTA